MKLEDFLPIMAQNAQRIRTMVAGVDETQARWKPSAAEWSILEVVNHLLDEERHDFRVRLDYILTRPGESWPHIDPEGWVTQRHYNETNLAESLQAFLDEREWSIEWLKIWNRLTGALLRKNPLAASRLVICSPLGSPMICCTCVSLWNYIGRIPYSNFSPTTHNMRGSGNGAIG